MDGFDFFKNFFHSRSPEQNPDHHSNLRDDFSNHGFPMLSDPFEIHRAFEKQMDEMMKQFSKGQLGFEFHHAVPSVDEDSACPRDKMLKAPGFDNYAEHDRKDNDIDEREIKGVDLDQLFKSPQNENRDLVPARPSMPRSTFQFQSITRIQRPDGSMEENVVKRNHDGFEETIEKKRLGEQEYEVVKRKNPSGEITEEQNLVNIGPDDVLSFNQLWDSRGQRRSIQPAPHPPADPQFPDSTTKSIFSRLFGF